MSSVGLRLGTGSPSGFAATEIAGQMAARLAARTSNCTGSHDEPTRVRMEAWSWCPFSNRLDGDWPPHGSPHFPCGDFRGRGWRRGGLLLLFGRVERGVARRGDT